MSTYVLFYNQICGNVLYVQLVIGGFLLLIPLFLLRYKKDEIFLFYNAKDDIDFTIRVNSENREKLNQVVDFVKKKAAANNQPSNKISNEQ